MKYLISDCVPESLWDWSLEDYPEADLSPQFFSDMRTSKSKLQSAGVSSAEMNEHLCVPLSDDLPSTWYYSSD